MLEYDRRDISEGIDINETNASKECNICHYGYFLSILIMNHIFVMVLIIWCKKL